MMQLIQVLRTFYPLLILVAQAYAYGMKKYGDGEWKKKDVSFHLEKATKHMVAWKRNDAKPIILVDACLRLMFAAYIALAGTDPEEYLEAKDEKEQQ